MEIDEPPGSDIISSFSSEDVASSSDPRRKSGSEATTSKPDDLNARSNTIASSQGKQVRSNAKSYSDPNEAILSGDSSRKPGKCGECKSCQNPHWHKKCEVLKEMELQNGIKPQKRSSKKASIAPISKNRLSSEATFADRLKPVLQADGGVRTKSVVPEFLSVCEAAQEWPQRLAVLKVLQLTRKDILDKIIATQVLIVLEKWLVEATTIQKERFLLEMLITLSQLPVTLDSLKKPCEIGKAVGRVRKADSLGENIKEQARLLVAKWKALVTSSSQVLKEHSSGTPSTNISENKSKSEKEVTGEQKEIVERKLAAKTGETTQKEVPARKSGHSSLGDVDIFAAKPKSSQSSQQQNTHVRVVASNMAKPSQILETSKRAAPKSTTISKVSASPLDSLSHSKSRDPSTDPSASSVSRATVFSTAKPQVLMGPLTAAQRAKMAADKVTKMPKRQKKNTVEKKVHWVKDDSLVSVRWFLQLQPPCKASKDATAEDLEAETKAPDQGHDHKQFVSAAKQEHKSEAEVLKKQREEDDKEKEILEARLRSMRPAVSWRDPPFILPTILQDEGIAMGEESTEKIARAEERTLMGTPAKLYSRAQDAPESPEEAPSNPMPRPLSSIPRIPLSVEEARQWALLAIESSKKSMHVDSSQGIGMQRSTEDYGNSSKLSPSLAPGLHAVPMNARVQPASNGAPQAMVPQPHINAPRPRTAGMTPHPRAMMQSSQTAPASHRPMTRAQPKLKPMLGLHGPAMKSSVPSTANKAQRTMQVPGVTASGRPVCAYYNTPRGCVHGDNCRYAHEPARTTQPMKRDRGPHETSNGPRKMVRQNM